MGPRRHKRQPDLVRPRTRTAGFVVVIGGLVACLGITATTFLLIERITGPEIARNE